MGIDASIISRLQPAQFESPANQLAKLMQVQNMQQSGQLNALTLEEKRRGMEEANALSGLYRDAYGADGKIDRNKLLRGAADKGLGAKIPTLQKGFLEEDKAATDAEKNGLEVSMKKVGFIGQLLGSVRDQASYEAALQTAAQNKLDVSKFPPLFDPGFVEQKRQETLTTKEQLEQKWRQMEYTTPNANSVLSAKTATENNKRSVSASLENAGATRDVAQATRDAARIQTGFGNEQGLRKEFEALPEVKKYKQALPSFKGIEDAVSRNTPQSDINIVYGIAKLYDPDSVVREGEYATVANSPNIPDRIKGYAQYLAGGGKLTPKVKGEILAEATSRMKSYETEYSGARSDFESIAQRSGVDSTRVFPSPVKPAVKPEAKPGAAAAGPKPGAVQDGYKFKGGNPADPKSWEKV